MVPNHDKEAPHRSLVPSAPAASSRRHSFRHQGNADGPRVEVIPGVVGIEAGGAYAWIVRTSHGAVLIDAGLDATGAAILAELKAQSVEPGQVHAVLITHGHPAYQFRNRPSSSRNRDQAGSSSTSDDWRSAARHTAHPGSRPPAARPSLRRHCAVTVAVDDERRRLHLRQQRSNVDVSAALQESRRIFRRRGHALEFIEPLLMFWRRLGNESTGEHLAEGRVVQSPPESHQTGESVAAPRAPAACRRGSAPPRKRREHQVRDALRMPHGIRDGDGTATRDPEQRKSIESRRVDDRLEIAHPRIEAHIDHVAL